MSLVERGIPDLVHLLGVVTGLILMAMVLAVLCTRRDAAVRHGIWLCSLIAILVSPLAVVAASRAGLRLATIAVPWPETRLLRSGPRRLFPGQRSNREEFQPRQSPTAQTEPQSFTNLEAVTVPEPRTVSQATGRLQDSPTRSRCTPCPLPRGTGARRVWPRGENGLAGDSGSSRPHSLGSRVLVFLARFLRGRPPPRAQTFGPAGLTIAVFA